MVKRADGRIGGTGLPGKAEDDRAHQFGRWAMDSYGRVFSHLSRNYLSYLDVHLASYGFSSAHFPLLAYLWEGHGGETQNVIARELGVDKGTISRNIQTLVRLGLVVQAPCARDTRACSIELTEKGWELAAPVTEIARAWTVEVTRDLDKDQYDALLAALQNMAVRSQEAYRVAQEIGDAGRFGLQGAESA